jgi:transcriptional regulator with XRE-family HTH domain
MIKNDRQFGIIRSRVERLEKLQDELLDRLEHEPENRTRLELELRAVRAEIRGMQNDLDDYEALKTGLAEIGRPERIEDIPRLLVRARVAAGLSQSDLAERLGLHPQQVQRYEATDYESASLSKLISIARVLNVDLGPEIEHVSTPHTVPSIIRALRRLGLDRVFLERRFGVPAEVDDKAALNALAVASHVYSVRPESFLDHDIDELAVGLQPVAYKKPKRSSEVRAAALAGYAHYLSQLVARAVTVRPGTLPADPVKLHANIANASGRVTFDAALQAVWAAGVPVVPLDEGGGFHAAYWRHGNRDVIVINSTERLESLWLFYLLHEVGHLTGDAEQLGLIEEHPGNDSDVDPEKEARANEFATQGIFGGQSEELFELVYDRTQGNLALMQRAVRWVARTCNVDAGALAFNVAHRLAGQSHDWWGAARTLQGEGDVDPRQRALDALLYRLDWSRLGSLDAELLARGLGTVPPVSAQTRRPGS